MRVSSHERHRDALTALAGDTAILPAVSEAGERRGWWTAERMWRRTYGRFMPDATAFVTIVLASDAPSPDICRVDIFNRRPDACDHSEAHDVETDAGWARVARFPFDPCLPGLSRLAVHANTVVRYRPGKRCTFRTVQDDRPAFVKVYASDKGARVHRDLMALRHLASRGELHMAIAEPLRWDPATRSLWQAALVGDPATIGLCGHGGEELARRMGTAAASLARARADTSEVAGGAAASSRPQRHAEDLKRRVPFLAGMVHAIVERLADLHARCSSGDLRPVHGAPHPDQWLDLGRQIALIDFDRFSLGDPEMDVGLVLEDLAALRNTAVATERLVAAFLDGYRAEGGALREPLVQAYRAHRLLAKALRAAQAIHPDGDRRAAIALARAEQISRDAVLV